jgi:hypothetical protein
LPTIFWLDDRTYRVDQSDSVAVSETEDGILQAFLGHPTLNLKALAKRAGKDESHVKIALGRLRKKWNGLLADAIYCPGRGGKGQGYRANVVDMRPAKDE